MRYAIVAISNGAVQNIIQLDNGAAWTPPIGTELVQSDAANIDDVWDGARFTTPTAALTPGQVLAAKIGIGIAITSTGSASVSATYALDAVTLDQVGSVARDAAAGLGLPGGGSSFAYPDITGAMKTLSAANVQGIYKAMRDLLFALNVQAAILGAGGTPTWPAQTATIA